MPDELAPFDLPEIDDEVEQRSVLEQAMGAIGQIAAALAVVAVLGLIIVAVAAVLSWMFH